MRDFDKISFEQFKKDVIDDSWFSYIVELKNMMMRGG